MLDLRRRLSKQRQARNSIRPSGSNPNMILPTPELSPELVKDAEQKGREARERLEKSNSRIAKPHFSP